MLLGENGIINRTKTAKDENEKATATETMNLKITNVQISKYAEEQRMPTLKELADNFCEDNDFEKVIEKTEVGSLTKISNENPTAIIAKLKAYPYEFEINSSLQLASIDGIRIATTNSNEGNIKNNESTVGFSEDLLNWISTLGDTTTISVSDITNNQLLSKLMQNRQSVDYMFSNENIFNAVLESPYAMEELGKSEYAGYKAITQSEYKIKLLNSSYISYFDNYSTQIDKLTNNTNVFASSSDNVQPYFAFDKDSSSYWYSKDTDSSEYIGYNFGKKVIPYKIKVVNLDKSGYRCKNFYIQGSNDNSTYSNLTEQLTATKTNSTQTFLVNAINGYQYIRMYILDKYTSSNSTGICELQIYCRTIPND